MVCSKVRTGRPTGAQRRPRAGSPGANVTSGQRNGAPGGPGVVVTRAAIPPRLTVPGDPRTRIAARRMPRMVAAIELYFEPVAERRLRTLWTALDEAGVPTLGDHTHRRHRPHLSLACADEFPPEPVAAALGALPLPVP